MFHLHVHVLTTQKLVNFLTKLSWKSAFKIEKQRYLAYIESLPVGVSVIGGERHSMWNPLSHASQNNRLS